MKSRLKKTMGYISSEDWSVQSNNIRTLHSLCWAGLRGDFTIVCREDLAEFSQLYNWKLSIKLAHIMEEDFLMGVHGTRNDDDLWMKVQRARLMVEPPDADADDEAEAALLRQMDHDYRAFKNERGLIDFTGMVEEGIKRRIVPEGIEEIFVDEAQDMNKLFYEYHLMLYETLGEEVNVTWMGDEDQAIYAFMGADPRIFVDHPAKEVIYGELSRRMTAKVAREAEAYISANTWRYPKKIRSEKQGGYESYHSWGIDGVLGELKAIARGKVLWLALTNNQIEEIRDDLIKRGEPVITSEGEKASRRLIETLEADKGKLKLADLKNLTTAVLAGRKVVPYKRKYFTEPYKFAKEMEEWTAKGSIVGGGLARDDERFSPLLRGILMTKEWERLLDDDQRLIASTLIQAEAKEYEIELTTFHKAKGREAHTVVICKDVGGKILKGVLADEEMGRRLGFVAMTRALENNIYYRQNAGNTQDFWKVTR